VDVSPFSGRARDWRAACAAAARVSPGDDAAALAFFEREFLPYAAQSRHGRTGKLTAYYLQSMRGSRTRQGRYQTPLLARPADLVSVDLGAFIPDGKGRRVWGRVDAKTGALIPYPTRAEIRVGALGPQERVLFWIDDPVDALFAEIEGSGKVTLDDGSVAWVAFAGKNGRHFRGVGGVLRSLGLIAPGEGTMDGIRAWLNRHPDRWIEITDRNPAKVFFELSSRAGAIGTQGVMLTPRRSLAVDRAFIPLSTPIWVDTRVPVAEHRALGPWQHLLIAQDTGGGIIGPLRGDIYWGDDTEAAAVAGRMSGPGEFWLLLPRAISVGLTATGENRDP
jgi:membrane-bound lytic murein transglycosylase A